MGDGGEPQIVGYDPSRRTNARAITDLAKLGILRPDDAVLDMTVGPNARFWSEWRPARVVTNDVDFDVTANLHADGAAMPFVANTFDVAVWDPPYGSRGTSRLASDARDGLTRGYRTADDVDALVLAGTLEAIRVARRVVLVKCQDQRVSSRFRDRTGFDVVPRTDTPSVGLTH